MAQLITFEVLIIIETGRKVTKNLDDLNLIFRLSKVALQQKINREFLL
jgi:hypothetical protein